MVIEMFNFWYFFWLVFIGITCTGMYYLLRNKKEKTKKIVLFSILMFALILHFLKCLFPPYSVDKDRLYRDIFFINICAANICLFPIIFLCKNKFWKDYMFYLGLLGGGLALIYPAEPMLKTNQAGEMFDIIRFYLHHGILLMVPLLMVMLKLHTISYKRVWVAPACLLMVMLFIMLNQVLQSELGFVPLRGDNFFEIGYKNSAYIWGPDDAIGNFIARFCPDLFKTVPVDKFAGQTKYWPWVWLVVPAFVWVTPLAFFLSLIFDADNFKADVTAARERCKEILQYRK